MNINIGNPFFLHNEIVLHNSRLSINSKILSKLINVPYPRLLKTIKVILNQNSKRKNDFILTTSTYHPSQQEHSTDYLISPNGIDFLARGPLKKAFNHHNRKLIKQHLKYHSYDQQIQD